MRWFSRCIWCFVLIGLGFSASLAVPVKITSGQLFIGGSSYGTPDYQTYLRFEINGRTRMPQRNFLMAAEQINAVFMNHPARPAGEYDYKVGMPYHSSGLWINDVRFYPVWYAGCVWNINSNIQTPIAPPGMPQFVSVTAPFTMSGGTEFYGAITTGFRLSGSGTAEIKFENREGKYYLLEARYLFGSSAGLLMTEKAS